ncbi:predicted protein [Naegleria gruberi]|uniref:Predicted protein n=1 Tax=Naegleria gruberi TaxID=5762 RepID=D2W4H7_NAEGR|nr:uncharacterized protein NAEGRDRAFT_60064 [Naegleria gruberi]EFC36021.1 predicted protein [Naegleria gruberi]|eukprot:XP_002668765.1 predicted protein [Naegleria gruberi strain NEG-M]
MSNDDNDVPMTPRRASRQVQTKFNSRDYALVFEEAIKDKDCRAIFKRFLKKSRSEELMQFYEEYTKYDELFLECLNASSSGGSGGKGRRSTTTSKSDEDDTVSNRLSVNSADSSTKLFRKAIQKLWIQAQSMIGRFIQQGAEHEINIGSLQRMTFSRWQILDDLTPVVFQEANWTDNEYQTLLNVYQTKLDPNVLFEGLLIAVLQDLKHDQFPRFVRNDLLFDYLQKKGEVYTRAIAINVSHGFNVDVRFQPSDLQSKVIDEKMIFFGFTLLQDTPDWELILDKDDIQGYMSKTSYFFGKDTSVGKEKKGLRLHKSVYTLPFCIEDVWKMVCNQENHLKFDPKANEEFKLRDFREPNQDCEFAVTETEMGPKFMPIMKRRHFPFITTTFYDSRLKGYVVVCRSFNDSDNHTDRIHYDGFAYTMYIPNGDKATNVFMIDYSDIKMPFKAAILENTAYKFHIPTVQKGMVKVLNELTNNSTKNVEWNESMDGRHWWKMAELHKNRYPNKSWYDEWLKK